MTVSARRLGVHTSIAGGVQLSLERARGLGCNTVQIFSHNPRTRLIKRIPADTLRLFKEFRKAYDIDPVFVHSSYLINLASSDARIFEQSVVLLAHEMELADALGADYVILHTGSSSNDTGPDARRRAAEALNMISGKKKWRAGLLLENTAGERGDISSCMRDIAEIIDMTTGPLIAGICMDTCHAFAAGYDLTRPERLGVLVKEIERFVGRDKVRLVHLNDAKKACASHVDRHEHIGEGFIGKEGLKSFINHPAFRGVPLILETPKKSEDDDPRNLKTVRSLMS